MSLAIGIDLGTTNSCCAVYLHGSTSIIPDHQGKNRLSSFVYFNPNDDQVFTGTEAEKKSTSKPSNCIYDAKRLLCRKVTDTIVEENKPLWPFKLANQELVHFEVERNNKVVQLISPQEILAETLKALKANACEHLKQQIADAVITVPAYFTSVQRKATLEAAKLAGLNVLKLINEPTAAALAYAEQNNVTSNSLVLVYDLGGGTFDLSLVKFSGGRGKVLDKTGQHNLGGRNFENNLFEFVLSEIESKYQTRFSDLEAKKQSSAFKRLRTQCRAVKEALSNSKEESIDLDEIGNLDNVTLAISREVFEGLNKSLFESTIAMVSALLASNNISAREVNKVLLVGGSTRIPKIQQLLEAYFSAEKISKTLNPDEAVAAGAAIEAAQLSYNEGQAKTKQIVDDVTYLPLGVAVGANQEMSVVIEKGAPIPVKAKRSFYTFLDFQEEVAVRVYEGKSRYVAENVCLGEVVIGGITPMLGGEVEVRVRFQIDANGIFKVTARESSRKIKKDLTIQLVK